MNHSPRLLFVGPMLGGNAGWVVSQGEILARLFAAEGYAVRLTSPYPNRLVRLADTLASLVAWRRSIDLVLLAVFSGPAFGIADLGSLLAVRLGKPVISILRGGNLPDFARRHPAWVQRVLRRSAALVAPSEYLRQALPVEGVPTAVIPNVLDLDRYPYRHRPQVRPCLLWMRTFEPAYHPEMALEVFRRVRQELPEATLSMAGQDRGLLEQVRLASQMPGVGSTPGVSYTPSVRFPGFLDLAGKQREFAAHDIFLNTNRVDNMPVSVVEAAAFGLPVVATAVGGIPSLLEHEQTGLLVENEDAQAMAEAVLRLVREPALAARLSANGRRLAERSAWPAVKAQWEELFAALSAAKDSIARPTSP